MATWADVGERVREARLAAGLTQQRLGEEVGLDRTAVAKVETGDRRLSIIEAASVAEALRVPLALIVRPRPAAITSQRRPLGDDAAEVERSRARADLLVEAHGRDVRWLVEEGFLRPTMRPPAPVVTTSNEAQAAAQAVRQRLGLGLDPLPPVADVAEDLGLFLLVADEEVEGASLDEGRWGAAVVGGRAAPGRRRSTAAHELAHHVLGDAYASDLPVSTSTDAREQLVDTVASALLLPEDVVRLALDGAGTTSERRAALVMIAARYRVSWTTALAAARHALPATEERHLRPSPTRGEIMKVTGRDVEEDLQPGATGPRYTSAVLAAYSSGAVTADGALRLLHGRLQRDDLPPVDVDDVW
ncbi:XRE family transcriptional regulator [uncultured Pseudokineococcus sp.]|uniref:XRE family transcriptional regulator n=1 Tax=uncultured Pseudokineococcus sp. TaxID=1642928 RepID=UPI00261A12DA|nr:XRE family transcriptional regulator [uncultured Pseudokineococcus sp.]